MSEKIIKTMTFKQYLDQYLVASYKIADLAILVSPNRFRTANISEEFRKDFGKDLKVV